MEKILSAKSSVPSAMMIRDEILKFTGKRYLVTSDEKKVQDILFRYGHTGKVEGKDPGVNSVEFIKLASNKARFSEWTQANGIFSPVFHPMKELPLEFPIVVRKTLTGFGGEGIVLVNTPDDFAKVNNPQYFWTPYRKQVFELRVHLHINRGDVKVSRIYKKIFAHDDEGQELEEPELPIRNQANGYHFALRNMEKYPKAVAFSKMLGQKLGELGCYFTGADIGYDAERREFFIFEVNSAPGLGTPNAVEYAEFLIEVLGLEKKAQ